MHFRERERILLPPPTCPPSPEKFELVYGISPSIHRDKKNSLEIWVVFCRSKKKLKWTIGIQLQLHLHRPCRWSAAAASAAMQRRKTVAIRRRARGNRASRAWRGRSPTAWRYAAARARWWAFSWWRYSSCRGRWRVSACYGGGGGGGCWRKGNAVGGIQVGFRRRVRPRPTAECWRLWCRPPPEKKLRTISRRRRCGWSWRSLAIWVLVGFLRLELVFTPRAIKVVHFLSWSFSHGKENHEIDIIFPSLPCGRVSLSLSFF